MILRPYANLPLPYLRHEQDVDLQKFDIKFDVYYLESSLYVDGKVGCSRNGFIGQRQNLREGRALWLAHHRLRATTRTGYPQIGWYYTTSYRMWAYHVTKWQRGFTRVINVRADDHHSTIHASTSGTASTRNGHTTRLPGLRATPAWLRVVRGGEEVKIASVRVFT